MRDDLVGFADSMEFERFTLIGHSMGGTVAFLFAERFAARVARLVIEDTPPPSGGDFPEPPAEAPGQVPFDWRALSPIIRQLRRPVRDWWERLVDITAPTLLISGGAQVRFRKTNSHRSPNSFQMHGWSRKRFLDLGRPQPPSLQ